MPVTYSISEAERLVRFHYHGAAPTFAEWRAATEAAMADPEYRPGFDFLADRRGVAAQSVEFVRNVVEFDRARQQEFVGSRLALVVDTAASYGMSRMLQALTDGLPFRVAIFHDLEAAEAWLRGHAPPNSDEEGTECQI